ncbi:MAG: hypothetical protein HUU37_05685 [Bdellovibrionales bacterium]|nr:hypothetical protein [Bdellovibrionales bacterium]
MGLFEAMEEKKFDVRVVERARMVGKQERKSVEGMLKSLKDDSAGATWSNVDEINRTDNPVHVGRNLPSTEPAAKRNYEELELEAAGEAGFEQ